MSSMRNAVQRRNHKERAQPLERQKWGLLEKHKDYSLRARDFNAKRARLRALREKASSRNPDEFSFGMMSSRSKGGVKMADRGNKALGLDVVKLLKTQDVGYIRTMLQSVRKDRERLEEGLLLGQDEVETLKGGAGGKRKHVVFVEEKEEQKNFTPEEWFGVENGKRLVKVWNRTRKDAALGNEEEEMGSGTTVIRNGVKGNTKADDQDQGENSEWIEQRDRYQARLRRQLEMLKAKENALRIACDELDIQRAKMTNQIGGVNKNGVKWKVRARKR